MPISILMPALSPTMTEGNLVKWTKKEGDKVKPGEVLAEIETDKATMEVESVDEGILAKIFVPEGTQGVAVNTLIAALLEDGEDASALNHLSTSTPVMLAPPAPTPSVASAPSASSASGNRMIASPLAKRIADQAGIALSNIQGSGPNGRIIKADVVGALAHNPPQSTVAPPLPQAPTFTPSLDGVVVDIPLSGMRKTIAKRLVESKQTIPHFYLQVECRVDRLLIMRTELNQSLEKDQIKISVNDLIVKACGLSLRKVPEANRIWAGGDTLYQLSHCDVAVAVAIEGGLITPMVTQADQRGLASISTTVKDLARRAQAGQLKPQEYQGAAFTLSNLGMYGIHAFQAIINPPHASILAVGAAVQKPVVEKGALVIGNVLSCSLSVDHRILDGAVAAQFLQTIVEYLENPALMLV